MKASVAIGRVPCVLYGNCERQSVFGWGSIGSRVFVAVRSSGCGGSVVIIVLCGKVQSGFIMQRWYSTGDLANASGSQSQDSRGRVKKFFKKAWEKMSGSTISEDPEYPEFVDYSELEDLETPPRYRPDSLAALSRATRFTEPELKRIYRGFKAECPTGVVKEDTFKGIYSQFFPKGANTSQYAHYVFNSLDQDRSGLLSFEVRFCPWVVHPLPRLSRREAALDILPVRHQRRRSYHARGDDRHRHRHLRPHGQVRGAFGRGEYGGS
ncbi:uncharacterized protein LOC124352731 isoform X2 [Homalodisca vitripennis]|uniref:uncharacterized protein LOC124352731 isoform X2 n=1 Tax=Homalodisca vitripennis TaxID=197043 RepID=UPI001EEBD70A|nr:uncharacterized protein LOC124352731 isoform X2 [Homalodisca vitripennis]